MVDGECDLLDGGALHVAPEICRGLLEDHLQIEIGDVADHLFLAVLEDGQKEIGLVFEVVVERSLVDAGRLDDLVDRGALVPVQDELCTSSIEDPTLGFGG
ncbi:hypothetical protein D3C87_1864180 [compost metagenome]